MGIGICEEPPTQTTFGQRGLETFEEIAKSTRFLVEVLGIKFQVLSFQLDIWRLPFEGLILRTFHLKPKTRNQRPETRNQ